MTKKELVDVAALKAGVSKKDTAAVLDALTSTVIEALASGDKVQLVGFGTFEARERSERAGKNPKTGEAITVPACKVPAFKAGTAFKDAVNK